MTDARDILRQYAPRSQHWFHSFEVMPGIWSSGHKSAAVMRDEVAAWRFPADLTGKTMLDIGCADGGFSVEGVKRGAASVLAIDEQQTTGMRLFSEARPYPQIEYRTMSLFSDEFRQLPKFDFILFAGVLYHVEDQLDALRRVRSVAGGTVLLETIFDETLGSDVPYSRFFEGDECNGDPTNWWAPNFACLEGMIRTAGFRFERSHVQGVDACMLTGRVSYLLT